MRITTQMLYANANANIQTSMDAIYNDQVQIASEQKLNKPSDDPAAMFTIISGKAQLLALQGYQTAISNATQLLNSTSTTLDSLSSIIDNATQVGNDASSASASSTATYVEMMDNLINSAVSVANTKVGARYIFAGDATDKPAINTTTKLYQGTTGTIKMEINDGTFVDVNIPGNQFISSSTPLDNSTVIGAMTQLRTAINANDAAGIQTSLSALSNLSTTVLQTQSDIGIKLNSVNDESTFITSRDNDITNTVSDALTLSTADQARVITDLQQRETSLQSLYSTTSSFLQLSLFNFMK